MSRCAVISPVRCICRGIAWRILMLGAVPCPKSGSTGRWCSSKKSLLASARSICARCCRLLPGMCHECSPRFTLMPISKNWMRGMNLKRPIKLISSIRKTRSMPKFSACSLKNKPACLAPTTSTVSTFSTKWKRPVTTANILHASPNTCIVRSKRSTKKPSGCKWAGFSTISAINGRPK